MARVAVDTGGTFTDAVAVVEGQVFRAKVRSRPSAPDDAVRDAIDAIVAQLDQAPALSLTHGTTVGTNALLEHAGAETWLVINEGFEDLLAIGRQQRANLYALEPAQRARLVDASRTVAVRGRRDHHGDVLTPLAIDALRARLEALPSSSDARSWAVCLLHSYANGEDERRVGKLLNELFPGDPVSLSHEVMPEFREVERAGTTVANAHMAPSMSTYLERIVALAEQVDVMGSSGGRHSIEQAGRLPVHTALSGPAGGVVAAVNAARAFGYDGVISFDMGGTSTDVAFCRGELPMRYEGRIGAFPLHVPMLDIHTVGAGGGSLAFVDSGGALRVGPASAGADPGPACYGHGDKATVTDANVVLGRIPEDIRLAGQMPIEADRAHTAIAEVAAALGVTPESAARGILEVAVETMAGAIRTVSVERGIDPRGFPICAFGGAGGLHACALAERLGVRTVFVPAHAGLLSAVGMLESRPRATVSATVLGQQASAQERVWDSLRTEAARAIERVETVSGRADCRYVGQSFELSVEFSGESLADQRAQLLEKFAVAHEQRFGYQLDQPIEIVTLRAVALGSEVAPLSPADARAGAGARAIDGPHTIVRMSTTIFVAEGWRATEYADGSVRLDHLPVEEQNGRD